MCLKHLIANGILYFLFNCLINLLCFINCRLNTTVSNNLSHIALGAEFAVYPLISQLVVSEGLTRDSLLDRVGRNGSFCGVLSACWSRWGQGYRGPSKTVSAFPLQGWFNANGCGTGLKNMLNSLNWQQIKCTLATKSDLAGRFLWYRSEHEKMEVSWFAKWRNLTSEWTKVIRD